MLNTQYQSTRVATIFGLILFLGITGCAGDIPPLMPTPAVFVDQLTPYSNPTLTPHADIYPAEDAPAAPEFIPSPTPTPVVYSITEGDTLSGIAYQSGVKLKELLSANPGIDPNFLTIGMTITIPSIGEIISTIPNPTPIPVNTPAVPAYRG